MSKLLSRRAVIAATAIVGLGWTSAFADAPFGPKVGTKAPEMGALTDQNGKPRRLSELNGKNGVVLMFYRSAGWCPFCQAQLIAINEGAAEFEKRGYKIVGVSYDTPEVTKAFTERRALTYTLLSDPKSDVIDRWGLRDPQYAVGSRPYGVPRPIIFVLDRNGTIKAKLYEETYQKRPPAMLVVETLDKVAAGTN
jgi:peroxiredoxin